MLEYDLRDMLNKNQALAINSKGSLFRKNKQDSSKQSKHTPGIYFWLLFWVELTPTVILPQLCRGKRNVGPIKKKVIQEIKNVKPLKTLLLCCKHEFKLEITQQLHSN